MPGSPRLPGRPGFPKGPGWPWIKMNYYLTKYDIDLPVILLNLEYLEYPEDHLFQKSPGCLNVKGLLYKKWLLWTYLGDQINLVYHLFQEIQLSLVGQVNHSDHDLRVDLVRQLLPDLTIKTICDEWDISRNRENNIPSRPGGPGRPASPGGPL